MIIDPRWSDYLSIINANRTLESGSAYLPNASDQRTNVFVDRRTGHFLVLLLIDSTQVSHKQLQAHRHMVIVDERQVKRQLQLTGGRKGLEP